MNPSSSSSQRTVAEHDVAVLVGLLAIVEGELMAGVTERAVSDRFAERFVAAGLLPEPTSHQLPSPGQVRLAVSDLGQRLRYALGEYPEPPEPAPAAVAHILRFATTAAAGRYAGSLRSAGEVEVFERAGHGGRQVFVVCPELPPDPGFLRRQRDLTEGAARFGGSYDGFQGPPTASPSD